MTIGFFIDEYLPKLNGPVTSTIAFRQALEALGHTVYIVAPTEPGYKDSDDKVIRIASFDPVIFKNEARLPLMYPGLVKKLAKYKFDIVHSQTQFALGVLAHATAKQLKVPHVTTLHTIFSELLDEYKRDVYIGVAIFSVLYPIYFRSMPKFDWQRGEGNAERVRIKDQAWRTCNVFLDNTDAVIVPSSHVASILKQYGLKKDPNVLTNGVDTKKLRERGKQALAKDIPAKNKDIWVVCVSRMSPEKRQRALVEAMVSVEDPRVKLVLVGSGPSEEELRQQVAELGLQEEVYLLGRREPETIPSIVSHSDIFALASYRFDNQPMVILEALTAGLPLIYCDDQLTEGFTKKNALLAASPSPEDLAKAINTLAKDTKKRQSMGKESAMLSEEFDIGALAKKLEEIYSQAIESKAKPKQAQKLRAV